MRYGFLVALLPAYVAGAAQLGQVKTSLAGGITRASIPVTGKFNFTKAQLADRIYFDLTDVKPASSGTQRIAIDGPVVSGVRIAGYGAGTRVVFDLKMPADVTVSQSSAGLTVEVRAGLQSPKVAAPARIPWGRLKASAAPRHPVPAAVAEPAADLRNVPELPSNFRVPANSPNSATPAPVPVGATRPRAMPPERRAEKEYFDDSISDPIFPAVDEVNVQVPPGVAVFDVEDNARALPEVLRKHNGFFAFGTARDPGYAISMIRAVDSSPVDLPAGIVSLADYRVFPIAGDKYAVVDELRRKYRIDPTLNVYAVFPDAFDRVLLRQVRTAAAQRGRAGRVIAARFAFSATDPTGIEVLQVRVRPAPAQ